MRVAVAEVNPEALFCDGFDAALIGVANRFGMPVVAAYDYDKYIGLLVKGGCTPDEAAEYFDFNVIGAWVGDTTPVFIRRLEPLEISSDKSQKPVLK